MTIEEVMPRILELRQQIAAMGANDSEFYNVDQLIGQLNRGEIEPAQALKEVRGILNGKQDYH